MVDYLRDTFLALSAGVFVKKSHHELTNSRISKREFDISIIRKTKRMLGKFAFFGECLGGVNERHQDVGSDAVLVLFNGCFVLFNGWGDSVRMVF